MLERKSKVDPPGAVVFREPVPDAIPCGKFDADQFRSGRTFEGEPEFQVVADILKTAWAPSWNDILQLAALIALRTVLNFLLERELEALDSDGVIQ